MLDVNCPSAEGKQFGDFWMTNQYSYRVGGCLPPDDPSYVTRDADRDLYTRLMIGEFCYVLSSRQVGKSSLIVRTAHRLETEGWHCALLDLSTSSHRSSEEQWYAGLVWSLLGQLEGSELSPTPTGDRVELRSWWREQDDISPPDRFATFIDTVLLSRLSAPILLCFDEIDSILRYEFRDGFFRMLRSLYDKRAEYPSYRRLRVVLSGVATPSDFDSYDSKRLFEVGQFIHLTGFRYDEATPLVKGLADVVSDPAAGLAEVLTWTGGQPFLTQKLLRLIVQHHADPSNNQQHIGVPSSGSGVQSQTPLTYDEALIPAKSLVLSHPISVLVRTIVWKYIITNWELQDEPEHLKTIRDRLLNIDQQNVLLALYKTLLTEGSIVANQSYSQQMLCLTGVAIQTDDKIQIYNPIYRSVFDEQWLRRVSLFGKQ